MFKLKLLKTFYKFYTFKIRKSQIKGSLITLVEGDSGVDGDPSVPIVKSYEENSTYLLILTSVYTQDSKARSGAKKSF